MTPESKSALPKDSPTKQLSPAHVMWIGVVLMLICGWDSGMQGWIPSVDHGLLVVQGASIAVLLLVAVIKDFQLKSEQSIEAFIVWVLFLELAIVLHADLGYTQCAQLLGLKNHGIKAGAKILEANRVFEPRGSDKRPSLAKVVWLVTLKDGTTQRAEAIESGNSYFAARANEADIVYYLPENPTIARCEQAIEKIPALDPGKIEGAYILLLVIPAAVNVIMSISLLCLGTLGPPANKSKPPLVSRNLVLFSFATLLPVAVFLSLPKILEPVYAPLKAPGQSSASPGHPNAFADDEVFPSPNIPRAVSPYLMPKTEPIIARWQREQSGDKVLYQGFDTNDQMKCEFQCHRDAHGQPQADRECLISYQNLPQSANYLKGCSTEIRVTCSDLSPTDSAANQKSFRGRTITTYEYAVVGKTIYLTYVQRYHEVDAAGLTDDSLFVKFTRDSNQHLLKTTTAYDKPFDLNAQEDLLEQKFLFWSKFGQYQ